MKKGLLVMAICVVSLGGFAQSNSLGINAGFGQTWIHGYENNRFQPAVNVGLSYIHSTKTNFGFGADLKYSREGGKTESTTSNITTERNTSLDYIRIPVKAMYFFGNYGQRLRPKVAVGPSFGFLVGGEDEVEVRSASGSVLNSSTVDANQAFEGFDIGLTASAGVNYRIVRNTWFTADLGYYNGFRNLRDAASSSPKLTNRNITLNVGVNWGIGK